MGRRKIEIKAIKDDRNRSVTFLKRKGGLFKKAHELSVLCSVDVAVIIFGNNKKLYEYSSSNMREITDRYQYYSGPKEHKGPSDFNGGDDDDDDDDGATPPRADSLDPMNNPHAHMMTGPFHPQFPPHIRQHTQSASPPIISGPFQPLNAPRGHTPQPPLRPSRPASRTDMHRMGAPMMPQTPPIGPPMAHHQPPVNPYAYMPQPPIYQPQGPMHRTAGPPMHQPSPVPPPYPYGTQPTPTPAPPRGSPMPPHGFDDRRPSVASSLHAVAARSTPSPPGPIPAALPHQPRAAHVSPPPQMPRQLPEMPPRMLPNMAQPMAPMEITPVSASSSAATSTSAPDNMAAPHTYSLETGPAPPPSDRPPVPVLTTTAAPPRKLPQRKGNSIFTPIDENRSMLSKHFSFFAHETKDGRPDVTSSPPRSRLSGGARLRTSPSPLRVRSQPAPITEESASLSATSSRSDSVKNSAGPPSAGVKPQLKVQIPMTTSESNTPASGGSGSPPSAASAASANALSEATRRTHGILLPPPSPSAPVSASALLSAGATGPPNPFARPLPQTRLSDSNLHGTAMNVDSPASALPSRFLHHEFLPSPGSFYPDWPPRAGNGESNTLPSPLNFQTPLGASGPSFLREDTSGVLKRKSPEISGLGRAEPYEMEAKRVKVE